jgi:hypothetical protein
VVASEIEKDPTNGVQEIWIYFSYQERAMNEQPTEPRVISAIDLDPLVKGTRRQICGASRLLLNFAGGRCHKKS